MSCLSCACTNPCPKSMSLNDDAATKGFCTFKTKNILEDQIQVGHKGRRKSLTPRSSLRIEIGDSMPATFVHLPSAVGREYLPHHGIENRKAYDSMLDSNGKSGVGGSHSVCTHNIRRMQLKEGGRSLDRTGAFSFLSTLTHPVDWRKNSWNI